MIHNLFPMPIGCYKLNRNLTPKEISFIKNQKTCPNRGNLTSVNNKILETKELIKLRNFIESSIVSYFKEVYNPKHEVSLRITQSWCNYTEPGQWHHKHNHSNSFISGVFYTQANPETDRIYFYRENFEAIKIVPENWNVWNSESWWFEVGTGDLILFPSSLMHAVEPVKGVQTRISLSFNTFPIGILGEEGTLNSLKIEIAKGH